MMQAAVRDGYGPMDVVSVRDLEVPIPTGDEIRVRVEAASVNRADIDLIVPRPGFTRLFLGIRAPRDRQIGCDVAGVVDAVGPEVTRFDVGDRVFADLYNHGLGSFAEFAVAREAAFMPIPDTMSSEDAATMPHAAILAIQGLRRRDGRTIQAGDRVLIDGASGNVGPFAIQIAKSIGAEVTAVVSTTKVGFARSIGADHVVDYQTTDYTTTGERYDWILASDAHHSITKIRRALRPKGRYVALGGPTPLLFQAIAIGPVSALATGKPMGLMLWWKPFHPPDVIRLGEMHAAGEIRPAIDRRYPLAEIRDALRYVDEGHARGKVLITFA